MIWRIILLWLLVASTSNHSFTMTRRLSFDGGGNITNRVYRNASGLTNRTQSLSYDAKNRLHLVMERNPNNYGFNWSAVYDGLNRRIATITTLVSNGVPSTVPPQTLNSYYDPQMESLELGLTLMAAPEQEFLQPGTSPSLQTVWKLYGPDANGVYGGLNGTGGLEGVSAYQNTFNSAISDARGNVLAEVTNGVPSWTLARPTAYGSVPGYRPVASGNGVDFLKSSVRGGHEVDVTGYYNTLNRPYDPVSGQWLSADPLGYTDLDPNGYTLCGGDPINYNDPDGLFGKQQFQMAGRAVTTASAFIDDQVINVVAGGGYLMHQSLGLATDFSGGDSSVFYVQANEWKSYMSPFARRGYYNASSPVAQVASAATIFVPGGAAGRVGGLESTVTREVGVITVAREETTIGNAQVIAPAAKGPLLLPAPPQPVALLPANAQSLVTKSISTPYGPAVQATSDQALTALAQVKSGVTVYRQGRFGVQNTTDAQFWSLKNPATTPGYSGKMGLPGKAAEPDWIMGGTVRPGAPVITRPAPAGPGGFNPGGDIETVVNPGDVIIDWFHMPE
jgi:RHS repeat-associated protein